MADNAERKLEQSGRDLFRAFQNYRGSHWGDYDTPEDFHLPMLKTKVQDLDAKRYAYFGRKSLGLNQAGTPALKYFFPRVLVEAASLNDVVDRIDLAFYIDEMNIHNWTRWPGDECKAITSFLGSWFAAALSCDPYQSDRYTSKRQVETPLKYLAFLGIDIAPFLADWARDQSSTATAQLVEMLRMHTPFLTTHALLHRWDSL